jgi:hypothetical protein
MNITNNEMSRNTKVFNSIIHSDSPIYLITIASDSKKDKKDFKHMKDLSFRVKNSYLNKLRKIQDINLFKNRYLYCIETGEKVSRGNQMIEGLEYHAHIILATYLSMIDLEDHVRNVFPNSDIDIKDITKNTDKANLNTYFHKQNHIMTSDNIVFKVK